MFYRINDSNNSDNLSYHECLEDMGRHYMERLTKDNVLGIGVYSCPDFRLLQANDKYSKCVQGIYCQEDALFKESKLEILLSKTMETDEITYLNKFETTCSSGETQYWTGDLTPITKDGRVHFIIATLKEITDLVQAEKKLAEKNEELSDALHCKDESLVLITHELKTPLAVITSIIQAIEICCKNELTDQLSNYLKKIKYNTDQQLGLVNNILDNARMNPALYRLNLSNINIIESTKTIIESINSFAEQNEIKISFYSPMTNLILETDSDIYERILLNLLSNAIKFTTKGKSVKVSIFKIKSNVENRVCIQVKDNGIGIPNDKKDLIFERFRRVDSHHCRSADGSGVGLYLVKMLVSLLGGEIRLKSKEGAGSTFSLILPVKYSQTNKTLINMPNMESVNDRLVATSSMGRSDNYYGA